MCSSCADLCWESGVCWRNKWARREYKGRLPRAFAFVEETEEPERVVSFRECEMERTICSPDSCLAALRIFPLARRPQALQ